MAEEEKENKEEKNEAQPAKSGNKKLLIIIAGVVVLLLAIGIPTAIFLVKGSKDADEKLAKDAAKEEVVKIEGWNDLEEEYEEGETPLGAIFPLQTFVVNLADQKAYLRCQMHLEFNSADIPKRYYVKQIPVRDAILKLLAQKKSSELQSENGRDELKEDLRSTINKMLKHEDVKNIYFTQFVMQ
jgi:flagellar FliL protein